MMSDRQTQLEELLAHQQRLLDDLNASLTQVRDEFDAITREHLGLKKTVARLLQYQEGAEDRVDERPPHY